MATIGKITTANSGSAAIDYAYGRNKMPAETKDWLKQQGVDPTTVDQLQSRAVVMSGLNVDPEYAKTQMKATRDVFSTHGKQTTRVIQSFPESDLDPANPHDWQRTNQLGLELAQKAFPDYQVAVYTQLDGRGHKLHNHLIVNMPNLKTGEKYHEHQSWQRLSRINDEISREHGLSIIDREQRAPERRTMAERQLEAKDKYVWKDDLRSRVDKVMSDTSVSSYKDFSERLAKSNIIVHERGENFSYEFLDAEKKHRRARGKALGSDYERETILDELELRQKPADPDISHLRNYSREAETSYLSSRQRSDRNGRDHQIATINYRETEKDHQNATSTGRSVDGLTISIGRIRNYFQAFREKIELKAKQFELRQQRVAEKLFGNHNINVQRIFPVAIEPIKIQDQPLLNELVSDPNKPVPMILPQQHHNKITEVLMHQRSLASIVDVPSLSQRSDKAQLFVYSQLDNQQLSQIITYQQEQQLQTKQPQTFKALTHSLNLMSQAVAKQGLTIRNFQDMMKSPIQPDGPTIERGR